MSLFCLAAIFGNLLFIISYIQLRWLRTARHAYIINLAIADLIMGNYYSGQDYEFCDIIMIITDIYLYVCAISK